MTTSTKAPPKPRRKAKPEPPKDGSWYDAASAARAVRFFSAYLRHAKGQYAGQPFILQPWQAREIVEPLFGWKRPDGARKYRRAYIRVPRGNGKSQLGAAIGLYLMYADGEMGAEIFSCAADRDQAAIAFDAAKAMVEASPSLLGRSEIFRRSIVVPATSSSYKVLSADVPGKHGLNAHGIIFDELHAQTHRDLWDVLTTATVKRRQPLTVAITTAGYDRHTICWEIDDYAQKVEAGIIEDPTFLPVLYGASQEDDWTDPKVWEKANPGYGTLVQREYLETECNRAKETPGYVNSFRRLHLNVWSESVSRWLDMAAWDDGSLVIDEAALLGNPCWAGLDLSTTTDITALALAFRDGSGGYTLKLYFWVPEENIARRTQRDRVPYDVWVRQGFVTPTEGNVVDYDAVRLKIGELGKRYSIQEIAFDPWNATQLSSQLQSDGFRMVELRQGFASLTAPTKDFEKIVVGRQLHHGGNPVLRWMASNVVVEQDPAGNLKPSKAKSTERIDGIVAGVMAIGRASVGEDGRSAYEDHGIAYA